MGVHEIRVGQLWAQRQTRKQVPQCQCHTGQGHGGREGGSAGEQAGGNEGWIKGVWGSYAPSGKPAPECQWHTGPE